MIAKETIVIADDEEEVLELYIEALKKDGRTFIKAKNGEEAILAIIKSDPDVVITDYQMPKMNGLSFLSKLHSHKLLIPTIMVTGNLDISKELQQNAFMNGVLGFLEKPVNFGLLEQYIDKSVLISKKLKRVNVELEKLCKEQNVAEENKQAFKKIERQRIVSEILIDAMSFKNDIKKTGS